MTLWICPNCKNQYKIKILREIIVCPNCKGYFSSKVGLVKEK